MESYKYIGKSRITKGNRVVKEDDLAGLPEKHLDALCKKKIIQIIKQKKDDSSKP